MADPTFNIEWDKNGERKYETGVDRGVLYNYIPAAGQAPAYFGNGVAWNGLTGVTESPSGAEATALWADNVKYLNLVSAEEFGATVEAYTYPDEFMPCLGYTSLVSGVIIGQQARETFGMSYRTLIGNDLEAAGTGEKNYKIHLIYNALAAPSESAYSTVNDSPEAITFSWELSTTPMRVSGNHKPTASLVIDCSVLTQSQVNAIEEALYGTGSTRGKLLTPDEVLALLTPAPGP